ncbi:MAG: MerR family transcriptional regulator [Fusicatenibacter sp.]|nr:MerR family transcriptional regulator [Lachnospiraceae bacterium]MDY2938318.1 MerR family transcriptional regulator [Fusicatenibacter sp.]
MKTYTIGELAELFSIPASTLRYYEKEGILVHVEKNSSGQRIYTEEHVERLKGINCFKRTGMTISQIRTFFDYETDEAKHIDEIIALLEEQEKQVNDHLSQLLQDSEHVHRKVVFYQAVKDALEKGQPRPRWEDGKKEG